MALTMMKATSKSGKLTAYMEESLHHQPYYIVYITELHIPIAFIIKNDRCVDIYDLPLDNATNLKIGNLGPYVEDLLGLMKTIEEFYK